MLGDLPSKSQLEGLRSRGIVSLMPLVTRSWIVAAVFGTILFFGDRALERLTRSLGDWSTFCKEPGRLVEPLLIFFVALSAVTLFVGVVTTMVQTRAASGLPLLRTANRLKKKRVSATLFLNILLVGTGASFAVYLLLQPALYTLQIRAPYQIDLYFGALAAKVCKLVVVVAVVLAILAMFVSRGVFLFKHRKRDKPDRW